MPRFVRSIRHRSLSLFDTLQHGTAALLEDHERVPVDPTAVDGNRLKRFLERLNRARCPMTPVLLVMFVQRHTDALNVKAMGISVGCGAIEARSTAFNAKLQDKFIRHHD
jgi:hypothetical protein